jgi:hypothetical protein
MIIMLTEVFEECRLRGYDRPGPINLAPHRSSFEHSLDAIPDMERALRKEGSEARPLLLKFGATEWLQLAMDEGKIRIAPASYYASESFNHARRDLELERVLRPSPRSRHYASDAQMIVRSTTDYYLYSLCTAYSPRLFGDFSSSACLIIDEPGLFLRRITEAMQCKLQGWRTVATPVTYYDPVRVGPSSVVVESWKPFKHAYQGELRLISMPPTSLGGLPPLEIDIGPLNECARLVDLNSHPAPKLPHEPADDAVRSFGTTRSDSSMMHLLPDIAQLQGIALYKSGRSSRDWHLEVQYTDKADVWHQFKIPVSQALYLMHLLQEADKEQHLSFLDNVGKNRGW